MAKKNKRPNPVVTNIAAQPTEFNPDYSIIKRDLGRIGLLAGMMIAGLIALSFFIK